MYIVRRRVLCARESRRTPALQAGRIFPPGTSLVAYAKYRFPNAMRAINRKENPMRNTLLATTAAMLVGMTLAAAQNTPNGVAQSERSPAGAQQGRDMQRGA